ncbi:hypothetical protein R1flu_023580 [Riccia fluitans]|uniref:Uncharacterized protein n=1 Tax=Riccia fluitans TaxID=41844 RepID=A0ABD1XSF6_9MARC
MGELKRQRVQQQNPQSRSHLQLPWQLLPLLGPGLRSDLLIQNWFCLWKSDTTETKELKESGMSVAVVVEDLAPRKFAASTSSASNELVRKPLPSDQQDVPVMVC